MLFFFSDVSRTLRCPETRRAYLGSGRDPRFRPFSTEEMGFAEPHLTRNGLASAGPADSPPRKGRGPRGADSTESVLTQRGHCDRRHRAPLRP